MKFLQAIFSDPLFAWSAIAFVVLYFGFLRRRKVVYGKDGIAYNPETGTYRIYDVGLYFGSYFSGKKRVESARKRLDFKGKS